MYKTLGLMVNINLKLKNQKRYKNSSTTKLKFLMHKNNVIRNDTNSHYYGMVV